MRTDQAAVPSARFVDPHASDPDKGTLGFERLVFFSDAVFAIVITLLVLPLTAEIELPEGGRGLAGAVFERWPTVLTFVVSFLVIGQFWTAHHRTFGLIERQDQTLLWLNLVGLLTVAFLPFPAAILGARNETGDAFPVAFFAASMTLTSCALTATWLYAARSGLVRPSLGRDPDPAGHRSRRRHVGHLPAVGAGGPARVARGHRAVAGCDPAGPHARRQAPGSPLTPRRQTTSRGRTPTRSAPRAAAAPGSTRSG